MAVPSNRSPSPISSRRISQSRNSDSNSATRRSFSGNHFPRPSIISNPRNLNPVTPANSPAGFGRKNSAGNLQGCDEKENDKDQTSKVVEAARSPANGSKSFMAPTISAASKFTPSPRKKILVERNDPVRTSISLSEGKATFFSAISSEIVEDLDQPNGECSTEPTFGNLEQNDTDLDVPRVSKSAKRVTFLEGPSEPDVISWLKPETVVISSDDCRSIDLGSKNPPSLPDSPIIAPLDADPSLPPYDPKTNFLSPRPQFLHYKPNRRIEVLLNKEKGLELGKSKSIEGNFMLEVLSKNFSDTDGKEGSSSEDSQKDSEDSVENVLPEGTEEELYVSESTNSFSHVMPVGIVEGNEGEIPANSPISHGISEGNFEQEKEEKTIGEPFRQLDMSKEEVVYDNGRPKPSFLKTLKFVSLLLILVAACVTFYPSMDTSVLDTSKFPKLPDASEIGLLTKENLNQLGARFKKLSFDSISHLSLLFNNLGRGDNFGHVQFMNLTYLEDEAVCNPFDDLQQSLAQIKDLEEEKLEEEEWEADLDERELEDASELSTEELVSAAGKLAELTKSQSSETLRDIEEASPHADTELQSQENSEDELALPSVASANTDDFELEMGHDSVAKVVESSSADVVDHKSTSVTVHSIVEGSSSEMLESPTDGSENNDPAAHSIWGIASIVFALVSVTTFMFWKPSKSSSNPNVIVHTDGLSAVPEKIFQSKSSYQNCAAEVDAAEEESCSSEMSSFQRSSSYWKEVIDANEVQSQDRKARKYSKRESLASSSEFSTGSPSYGSFTTYERISSKQANGDDEIMTPVRRSSRIRDQVISP